MLHLGSFNFNSERQRTRPQRSPTARPVSHVPITPPLPQVTFSGCGVDTLHTPIPIPFHHRHIVRRWLCLQKPSAAPKDICCPARRPPGDLCQSAIHGPSTLARGSARERSRGAVTLQVQQVAVAPGTQPELCDVMKRGKTKILDVEDKFKVLKLQKQGAEVKLTIFRRYCKRNYTKYKTRAYKLRNKSSHQ